MKKTTKLLCVLLALVMLIGAIPVSAKEKSEKINDYIEASFDVYNVPIVASSVEFKKMIDENKVLPVIEIKDDSSVSVKHPINIKKNGCLLVKAPAGSMAYWDETGSEPEIIKSTVEANKNVNPDFQVVPVRAGDKISVSISPKMTSVYMAFIPEDKIFHIDEAKANKNKTLSFRLGNIYGNKSSLSVSASKNSYSLKRILFASLNGTGSLRDTLPSYEFTSVSDNGDAVLTLPESGEYTLFIKLSLNGKDIANTVISFDTDKYIKPTLDKLEAPISAIYGTNVIVGYAEPSATVYLEYDGQKYQQKANRKGIYRIILDEDMKEGTPFKIWQSKDKLTSKKAKYRVTDNV